MCLASVYVDGLEKRNVVATNVAKAEHDGETWTFTDFLGVQTSVTGSIESMDLTNSVILMSYKPVNDLVPSLAELA